MLDLLPGADSHMPLACAATFAAGLIRGFAGFGSGMIMVAVLLSLYPPMLALPTVLFTELVLSLILLPTVARHVRWPLILPVALAAAFVAPLGVWVLSLINQDSARILASVMILVFVIFALLGNSVVGVVTKLAVLRAGAFSGFMGGVAGMTGPPVVALLLRMNLPPREVRSTLIGYFVIIDGLLVLNFSLQGDVGLDYLVLGLIVLIPLICGSLLGAWLFPKASPSIYRNLALVTVSAAAVISPTL
ncbi:MAG: sulfite exporter TauE/SafE family protein [Halioglobus sp.]